MRKSVNHTFCIKSFCSAFDFKWSSGYKFNGERHAFWEFVCVLDGRVESVEDEKVYLLSAGDMVCHAPGEFHRIRSYANTEPHVAVISFEHEGELPELLKDGIFSLSMEELNEYNGIFSKIYRWYHGQEKETLGAEATALLTAFILRLTAAHSPCDTSSSGRRACEYRRIVEVMQSGIYDNLTLFDIAARAAVSVSTVKSLFLSYSSISPIKYYGMLRVEEAKKLLSQDFSVSEIAEKMNFSSPNYFCSFFKSFVGVPPTKFKK